MKLEPEHVAKKIGLSLELYMDIENGRIKVNDIIAEKLSELYRVPKQLFIADENVHYMQAEVMYSNCTFINGSGSSSGYINHQYNDRGIDEILFSKKEEIKKLQDQIEHLQQQNIRLMELLGERLTESV
ncbi:MAG: hypothetical protein ACTHMD_05545 [Flavisolibacter sp.]